MTDLDALTERVTALEEKVRVLALRLQTTLPITTKGKTSRSVQSRAISTASRRD
jgi:hypothetical protein